MWIKLTGPYLKDGYIAADEIIFIGETDRDGVYVKTRTGGLTGEGLSVDPAYGSAKDLAELIEAYFTEDDEEDY